MSCVVGILDGSDAATSLVGSSAACREIDVMDDVIIKMIVAVARLVDMPSWLCLPLIVC